MSYIKSPLNYIGGKYKLLPQILPLFPNQINTFVDVFGGGATVSLNVEAKNIVYNDIIPYVSEMFLELQKETLDTALDKIHSVIDKYGLSITNVDGFNQMREDYNKGDKRWEMFYMLVCHSFNYQYRFNNSHEYNSSFGKNRSWYSPTTEQKFIDFFSHLKTKNLSFNNYNFKNFDFEKLTSVDFVYLDPPYSITTGNYNDGKRGFEGWSKTDDVILINLLDKLTEQGIKWALSNVLTHKGKSNDILIKWCEDNKDKYIVHHLNHTYSNCNYHDKTGTSGVSDEVLICNYHKCGDCYYYGDCDKDNSTCDYSL